MSNAAIWTWFAVSWLFIGAVAYKRWRERERRDQAATKDALSHTKAATDDSHIWDGA